MPRPLSAAFKRKPPPVPLDLPPPRSEDSSDSEHSPEGSQIHSLTKSRSFHARSPTTMSATYAASSHYGTLPRRTVTSELSDFLRDTGPPETSTTPVATKESSSGFKAKLFGAKSKRSSHGSTASTSSTRRHTSASFIPPSIPPTFRPLPNTQPKRFANGQTILMINTPPPSTASPRTSTQSTRHSPISSTFKNEDSMSQHRPYTVSNGSGSSLPRDPSLRLASLTRPLSPIDAALNGEMSDVQEDDPGGSKRRTAISLERDVGQEQGSQRTSLRNSQSRDSSQISVRNTPASARSSTPTVLRKHSTSFSSSGSIQQPVSAPPPPVPRRTSKSSDLSPFHTPALPDDGGFTPVSTPPQQLSPQSGSSITQTLQMTPLSDFSSSTASPVTPPSQMPLGLLTPHLAGGGTPPIDYKGFRFPVPPLTSSPSDSNVSEIVDPLEEPRPRFPAEGVSECEDSDGEPSVINHGGRISVNGRHDPTDSMIDLDQQIEEVLNLNMKYQTLASQGKAKANSILKDGHRPSSEGHGAIVRPFPAPFSSSSVREVRRRSEGHHASRSRRAHASSGESDAAQAAMVAATRAHRSGPSAHSSFSSSKSHPALPLPSSTVPPLPFPPGNGPPKIPLPPSPTAAGAQPASNSTIFPNGGLGPAAATGLAPTSAKPVSQQSQINSLTYALHTQRSQYEALAAHLVHSTGKWDEERAEFEARIVDMDQQLAKQTDKTHRLQEQLLQAQVKVVEAEEAACQTEQKVVAPFAADLDRERFEHAIAEQAIRIEGLQKQIQEFELERSVWEKERKGLRWLVGQGSSRVPPPIPPRPSLATGTNDESVSPKEKLEVTVTSSTALGTPSAPEVSPDSAPENPKTVVIQRPSMKTSITLPTLDVAATLAATSGLTPNSSKRDAAYFGSSASPRYFNFIPPSPTRMSMDDVHLRPLVLGSSLMSAKDEKAVKRNSLHTYEFSRLPKRPSTHCADKASKRSSLHGLEVERNSLHAPDSEKSGSKRRPKSAIGLGQMLEELKTLRVEVGCEAEDEFRRLSREVLSYSQISTTPSIYSQDNNIDDGRQDPLDVTPSDQVQG